MFCCSIFLAFQVTHLGEWEVAYFFQFSIGVFAAKIVKFLKDAENQTPPKAKIKDQNKQNISKIFIWSFC